MRDATPEEVEALEGPAWLTPGAKPEVRQFPADANFKPLVADIEAQRDKPRPTQAMAAVRGAAQGASMGFADEAAGVIHALTQTKNMNLGQEYQRGRDAERAENAASAEAFPMTHLAGELAGGAATAPLGAGGVTAAGRVARTAGVGMASGLGASDADLTKGEVGKAAVDTATGGAIGAASQGLVEGGRKLIGTAAANLQKRITQDVVENGAASANRTEVDALKKAAAGIEREVVSGPDGKAVRDAYLTGGEPGKSKLAPVIGKVMEQRDAAYGAFEKAGRSSVRVADYNKGLHKAWEKAQGNPDLANAIWAQMEQVSETAKNMGHPGIIDLGTLREMTTKIGGKSAGVINSLAPSSAKATKHEMSTVAIQAMKDSLVSAAHGDTKLLGEAERITAINSRLHALITLDGVMTDQAARAGGGRSMTTRIADSLSNPLVTGGATATGYGMIAGDSDSAGTGWDRVKRGIAAGAVGAALPSAARALRRSATGAAIRNAQGLPVSPFVDMATQAMTNMAARKAVGKRGEMSPVKPDGIDWGDNGQGEIDWGK